ncbi:MAG: restriction endonuclease subunit S [Flavobacteriales bacterium]|nr:restriction endonuclease subunit S [Flavobacteriales bacterium]
MTSTIPNIEFVKFSKLYNWSVQYLLEDTFSYNQEFPLVEIGSFLKRSRRTINVQNGISYKRVKIKINNGGVFLRDIEVGENIGTKKQFEVRKKQFIFSRIDARNGAMGFVPDELDGAIVTNDFPVFDVDNSIINTEYLVLITTTKKFIEFAQSSSSGTTNRQRLDVDAFLSVQIPLPPLDDEDAKNKNLPNSMTQKRFVAAYNQKIEDAKAANQRAIEQARKMQLYIKKSLGISNENTKEYNLGLNFVRFKELDFWSLDTIKYNSSNFYPQKKIGHICEISSGGTPSRSRQDYFNGNIPWIKTGELKDNIIYETEEKITEKGLNNSSAKLYSKGSIVVAMYGATIGKTAKLGIQATTNQACAVLFNFNEEVLADYVWIYLQSQTETLKSKAYGSAQPNINARMIYDTEIPIPPKSIQINLIEKINQIKIEISNFSKKCSELKRNALLDFEHQIFNRINENT